MKSPTPAQPSGFTCPVCGGALTVEPRVAEHSSGGVNLRCARCWEADRFSAYHVEGGVLHRGLSGSIV